MAEYYSNSIGRSKKRKKRVYSGKSLTLFLLDVVATVVMLLLVFSTIAAVVCQYISPERSGIFSVIALGAPIIYLLDIVVMFYWVVRWRWYRAAMMIVVVFLGSFYLSRYYKIEFDRRYDISFRESRYIKVMTYNVLEGKEDGLVRYIESHNPDIICLQEICGKENLDALCEKYNSTRKENDGTNNQIFSSYKILRSGTVDSISRNGCVWADLKIKDDTVRVLSLHLQTTSIRPEDTQFLEKHEYILDSERKSKLGSIVERLVENNRKRAVQAEAIAQFLESTPYTTIVCGDFNDVPLSYTYNSIVRGLNDTFSEKAEGFAYTYDTKYKLLRIDNIFVSPSVEVVSYEVDNEANLSDHYPIISRIKLN